MLFFTERTGWNLQKRGTALNFELHVPYVIILWVNFIAETIKITIACQWGLYLITVLQDS